MDNKKRAHHLSAPISPRDFNHHTYESFLEDIPPPAYQPIEKKKTCYEPIPPPIIIIQKKPTRSKDACCWGCLAALCLCFGAKECC